MQKTNIILSVFITYSSLSGMYQQHAQPRMVQQELTIRRSCPLLQTMAFATTTMEQLEQKTKIMQRTILSAKITKNKPLAIINTIKKEAEATMGVLQILKEYKLLYSLPYKKVDNNSWYLRNQICATLQDDNPELFKLLLWQNPLDRYDVKAILNHAFTKNRLWAIEHLLGTVEPVGSTIPVARTAPIDLGMYNELQNVCLNNNSPVMVLDNGKTVPVLTLIAQHKMNFSPYPIGEQATEPVRQEPSLHEAAYKNDIYALRNHLRTPEGRSLLNSSAPIRDESPNTPLGFAIDNNNPEAAKLLIRVAKEYKSLSTKEETLSIIKPGFLSAACAQGNPRNVLLLTQNDAPLNEKGLQAGNTPLHCAVNLHYEDNYHQDHITDYLLSRNHADCTCTNREGDTALHRTIKTFGSRYYGANYAGFEKIVNLLVKNGASLEAQDSDGNTPLHLLLPKENYPKKARLTELLATKDNVNLPNKEGHPTLFLAAKEEIVGPLKVLIKRGASLTYRDAEGNTVLHIAAEDGNMAIVREILNQKVDLNIPNNNGAYPIHLAAGAANRHADKIVELFLSKATIDPKDNTNLKDSDGNTPLHYAVRENGYETGDSRYQTTKTLEVLLDAGADVNAQNNEGQSPLFYAIYNRYTPRAQFLIDNGADLLLRQNNGKTVLEYVKGHRNNKPTLVVLLTKAIQEFADKEAASKKRPLYPDDGSARESEKKARTEERQ